MIKTAILRHFATSCRDCFLLYVVYSEKVKALACLITQNDIDKAPDSLYLQIFRWCSFNIGIASHEGRASHENDDTAEGTWRLKIVPFEKKVVERYPKYFSYFVNCFYFVNNRHDAYDFRPEIPAEFDKIRELLESGYKKIKGVNLAMGEMYGTIAQNYAFCGSKFLAKTEEYVDKAQHAFGGGDEPKPDTHIDDHQRSFATLVGAYIDAGELEKARSALFKYLGISYEDSRAWNTLKPFADFNSYEYYVTVRFLAEIFDVDGFEEDKEGAVKFIHSSFAKLENHKGVVKPGDHPWQLWSYNLGRLALRLADFKEDEKVKYRGLAKKSLEKSLHLSAVLREKETIYVMQLLPLSALYEAGIIDVSKLNPANEIIDLIEKSTFLNKDHFKNLLTIKEPEGVLDEIAKQTMRYFPFNYR